MAFFSKVGNILKQTASSQAINAELVSSKSKGSIFQAVRCFSEMSSPKLFVGGLSYNTDEQALRDAFTKYGEVKEARVILDRDSGRSRGFGFVTFASTADASAAIQALDGQNLHGRNVRVNFAGERPARNFGGGGYGNNSGGNAGYGGGSRGGYGDQGGYDNRGWGTGDGYGSNNSSYSTGGSNFTAPSQAAGLEGDFGLGDEDDFLKRA